MSVGLEISSHLQVGIVDSEDTMIIDAAIREQPNIIQRKMIACQEYDRFRLLLRSRLTECGWKEQVAMLCRQAIAENNINDLTIDDIIDKVTPQARALVPDTIKKELLQKLKTYLMDAAGLVHAPQQRNIRSR